MPLTPQDVHNKVFGPTRFRRGYDEAEVDAFLDEVEAELLRLHAEIDSLRGGAGAGANGSTDALAPTGAGSVSGSDDEVLDVEVDEPVDRAEFAGPPPGGAALGQPPAGAWAGAQAEPFVVQDAPEGSTAGQAQAAAADVRAADDTGDLEQRVARTLVLAQRAADEAVRDAELQAEQLRTAAQDQAEQLRTAAQGEAERIRAEVAHEAERARRELEHHRAEAEGDVEQLRAFEREYRTRLRAYLELQLQQLDKGGSSVEGGGTAAAIPVGEDSAGAPAAVAAGPPSTHDASASSDAAAGAAPLASPTNSGLPTTDLPAGDPAIVPSVPTTGQQDLPPSIPVTEGGDYGQAVGITRDVPGEELRHESRDLHDDL